MPHFTTTIDIDAPPATVFDIICDVERWHEWTPSITSVTRLDAGPLRVGSQARVKQPKLAPSIYTVTAYEPGRGFDWVTRSAGVTGIGRHWVEDSNGASRVTLAVDFEGALSGVIAWLFGGLTRRYIAMEADGLKRRSERP